METEVTRSRLQLGQGLDYDRVPLNRPATPPPEAVTWWWHPGRVGVRGAPDWFAQRVRDFDPEIAITWNAYLERWQVWMRAEKFRAGDICWGWKLLFIVRDWDGGYAPLDERIFWRLYSASAQRWGNGREYWRHVEAELARDKEKAADARKEDVGATARDYFQYMQIKNIGSGSKFATHFA